jgi:hypothetical protein
MDVAIALLTLVLLAAVVRFVAGPLRGHAGGAEHAGGDPVRDERPGEEQSQRLAGELQVLEAAREAKYREIRDCELDFRTGKLSREDYGVIDAQLRAEAIEILDRLDAAREADRADTGSGP